MSSNTFSPLVNRMKRAFAQGPSRTLQWREQQLERMIALLTEQEKVFTEALHADLGKSAFEACLTEIDFSLAEARYARKHLKKWMKSRRVPTPLAMQPGTSRICYEPLGLALIIGAWNYPLQLTLGPLVGAIAAGNAVLLKPSEIAPTTSAALARWLPRYFDTDLIQVVQGGIPETTELLKEAFGKIFYTGSTQVGKIVMAAAAQHLTPVTLELGGKSPAIVDQSADLATTSRRLVFGKFVNAGQTCVAPDYVLVDQAREAELLETLAADIRTFFGDDPRHSEDYGRIIHARHFERLLNLLSSGGTVYSGGEYDADSRYFGPTIITRVKMDAPLMQEEIFGPLLPVIPVDDLDAALAVVSGRPRPLSLYVFARQKDSIEKVIRQTSAGGVCINETLFHLANPALPFGGVGQSGWGQYHGRWGFEAFSHAKAVFDHKTFFDPGFRYPPYTSRKQRLMRWILKH